VDGHEREYLVALPPATAPRPVPAVLLLHGYSRSIGAITHDTGLVTAATRAGLAVVVPQASGDPAHWTIPGLDGSDDVAFVRAVLDDLEGRGCVARSREYVAGFSNGAGLAALLTCRLPGRFAGVALVAGAGLVAPCPGTPAVPVLAFHGAADDVVPVAGGPVLGGRLHARPLVAALQAWAAHDRCHPVGIPQAVPGGVHETWTGCRGGTSVDLWTAAGVGHHWPRGRLDATAIVVDRFAHPSGDQSSLASR
jgi:polyhydroxybutyrate depolymerase